MEKELLKSVFEKCSKNKVEFLKGENITQNKSDHSYCNQECQDKEQNKLQNDECNKYKQSDHKTSLVHDCGKEACRYNVVIKPGVDWNKQTISTNGLKTNVNGFITFEDLAKKFKDLKFSLIF
ncbi:hypothetical protein BCF59_0213 [Mycoplasmopsis mustelae]|uniref:Uncharacterized protein n=1 Tax=Mycoplasmopsis mustelae TaxID=171289 RepID=A0A4V6Q6B8_9BACT|nr:hypothetical protein [Mycoplasmopsis mustelae]TDV24260.1 hypothetical protein BCF59_0213 [Mycoplasmopsis mustelae]